ncbi:MAG: hypothetical protein ACI9YT_000687, partial [Halobacteriales archaeon]
KGGWREPGRFEYIMIKDGAGGLMDGRTDRSA